MEKWKTLVTETLKFERQAITDELDAWADNDGRRPRGFNPEAQLESDLQCNAVLGTPTPYVLNVGCGFKPTSPGFRTKEGVAVTVVGCDPLAFGINEAFKVLEVKHEILRSIRRFIYPLAGEELNAAIPVGAFDAVWSENALLQCKDPMRVLHQAVRATKTEGVVCFKFDDNSSSVSVRQEGITQPPAPLWKVMRYDGGSIVLTSEFGDIAIDEVRGERVEVHQFPDTGKLMIKIRRPQRTLQEVLHKAKKAGLIIDPARG